MSELTPSGMEVPEGTVARFMKKVYKLETGCWEWIGAVSSRGYGCFWFDHKRGTAHRAAYRMFVRDADPDQHIDHLCRNILCVNPAHLEAVSPRENTLRGKNGRMYTVCKRGHEMADDNVMIVHCPSSKYPTRRCKTCFRAKKKIQNQKYRLKVKEAKNDQ